MFCNPCNQCNQMVFVMGFPFKLPYWRTHRCELCFSSFFPSAQVRVILKQNSQRFFCLDFRCESASHHFALNFFETGSLEGFVVLKLPQYFLQRARKLAQNLLDSDSDLMRPPDTPPPPPLPPAQSSAAISSRLHHSPLSRLASSTDRFRPLSSPPPPLVASRRPSPSS